MILLDELLSLGLHKNEATTYLYLLKNGGETASNVSRETKIGRTNCYQIFEELKAKGLVLEKTTSGRKVFIARDPSALSTYATERQKVAAKLVPELKSLIFEGFHKPHIAFYRDDSHIKTIADQLRKSEEVIFYGNRPKDQRNFGRIVNFISKPEKNLTLLSPKELLDDCLILWNDKVAFMQFSPSPVLTVVSNKGIYQLIRSVLKQIV